MAGTKEFTELDGTSNTGKPTRFSLNRAVENLHGKTSERSSCNIYKADDGSGPQILDISFAATSTYPKRNRGEESRAGNQVFYPMGLYAASGTNGASLFFHCPTKGSVDDYIGDTNYVKAEMFAPEGRLRGNTIDRDRMTVLNAASQKLVAKLGCEGTAKLPGKVPDPV